MFALVKRGLILIDSVRWTPPTPAAPTPAAPTLAARPLDARQLDARRWTPDSWTPDAGRPTLDARVRTGGPVKPLVRALLASVCPSQNPIEAPKDPHVRARTHGRTGKTPSQGPIGARRKVFPARLH